MLKSSILNNLALYLKFLFKEFISPLNYFLAIFIGIVINYLLGKGVFSSWVPFFVPILVQSISKASVKYSNRNLSLLIKLLGIYILIINRDAEPEFIKADRMPIGKSLAEEKPFSMHERQLKKGDVFYMFSDGYRDQFGGLKDSKYSGKRFRELLISIHKQPINMQHEKLIAEFDNWKGDREQIDDILVVGVGI